MRSNFYTFETYKSILDFEERCGKLKKDYFSKRVQELSSKLKELRMELKRASKKKKESLNEEIAESKAEYEKKRQEEIYNICERIKKGNFSIELRKVNAKGNTCYTTDNVESLLVSKVLMRELKRSYKYVPANRNDIVEELMVLLDSPMPKIVIRADIHHFFESIPQEKLIEKLMEDAYVSAFSLKCLKTFLYRYNKLSGNLETKVGLPRGVAFSSYLAEIFLSEFDRKVSQMNGVYFYKRYVDDIVIMASPSCQDYQSYWKQLEDEVRNLGLQFNKDEEKRSCGMYSSMTSEPLILNYLGYQFHYLNGKLDVFLTENKFNRYRDCIRLVFEKYKEIGNHTSRKGDSQNKRVDTTIQFMHRLNALTGNGRLNGRKNYVYVGTYYSNKYLTNLEQFVQLDEYLKSCLNNESLFCPSTAVFNYGGDNNYKRNIDLIREKVLAEYSFVKGFNERRMYRWNDYTLILRQLKNLYYNLENHE